MSADLVDKLINDIVSVTETLMESDAMDLAAYQPGRASVEKKHGSKGLQAHQRGEAKRPMSEGVHRSVC